MIKDKSILAIITARGGSKGLPGKNIRLLAGKPLIGWTVEAARRSKYIDRVIVSSEALEILDMARQFGADTPFVRPRELAGDLSKQEDAVLHAMDWMEKNDKRYDYMMLLTPTTPLRDTAEIDRVTEYMVSHPSAKSVMTVVECEHHPLFANILPHDHSMSNFVPADLRLKNRQELPKYYRLSASVCLIEWEYFKKHGSFHTPLTFAFITTQRNGLDIDGLADFMLADIYIKNPEMR